MIYVSGLFALWAPIARLYTHDFAASWHAVSIIPKTVVIGHGFSLVWLPTMFMVLLLAVLVLVLRSESPVWKTIWQIIEIISIAVACTFIILFMLDVVGVISLRDLTENLSGTNPPDIPVSSTEYSWRTVLGGLFLTVFVVLVTVRLSRYLAFAFEPADRGSSPSAEKSNIFVSFFIAVRDSRLPRVVSLTDLLKAIAGVFLISFLISVWMASTYGEPPLPKVEVTTTGNATVRGDLLAHVDGVWYVLNLKGEVLAVPDGRAQQARVFPEG